MGLIIFDEHGEFNMTQLRSLLFIVLFLIGFFSLSSTSQVQAQQAACTANDGLSYTNNSFHFTPSSWHETAAPIYIPATVTWRWAFTGTGTATLKFLDHPSNTVVADFGTFTAPSVVSYTFSSNAHLNYSLQVTGAAVDVQWSCDYPQPPPPPPSCTNLDGRMNSICGEPWQTASVYCNLDGAIDVYAINESGDGTLSFRVTASAIAALGIPSTDASEDAMMLGESDDGEVRLYRLPSGEFQVNSPIFDQMRGYLPNGYVYIWDGCES